MRHHSEEHKAKIASSLKGHPCPQEVRLKISATKKERSKDPKWHENFSKAAEERWQNPEYRSFMLNFLQSEERKMALSKLFKGRSYTDETRQKMSQGRKRYIAEHPEYRIKLQEAGLRGHYFTKPTKPERTLIKIIKKYNLPFKYVGNGEFVLGGKCPDFLNTDGKKQLIELFGTYWHDIFDIARRKDHFKQYGFETLIIWEDELKNKDRVIHKLKRLAKC